MQKKNRLQLLLSFILTAVIGFYYGNKSPTTVYGNPIVLTKYVDRPVFVPPSNQTIDIPQGHVDISVDLVDDKIHVGSDIPIGTTVNIRKENRLPETVKTTDTIIIHDYGLCRIDLKLLNKVAPLTAQKPDFGSSLPLATQIDR
jgi:hypothetical protein